MTILFGPVSQDRNDKDANIKRYSDLKDLLKSVFIEHSFAICTRSYGGFNHSFCPLLAVRITMLASTLTNAVSSGNDILVTAVYYTDKQTENGGVW